MSERGRNWIWRRWRTLLLLAIVGAVGWSGYSYWREYSEQAAKRARELMAPAAGARCVVELADEKTVVGTFVKLNDEWIVLSQTVGGEATETWVPRENVQLMRVE